MDGANLSFIAVFDGYRHPLKSKTTQKRRDTIDVKSRELEDLIAADDPNNYPAIRKLRQDTVHIRPDIIAVAREWCDKHTVEYVCAPFEADWQLAMMCQQELIQGVISEDSDMIVLGCQKVIMDLNLADKTFILFWLLCKHNSAFPSLLMIICWRMLCFWAVTT
jgi:exonuclease-1